MLERRASAEIDAEVTVNQLASIRDSVIEGALFTLLEFALQPQLVDVVVSFPTGDTAEVVVLVDNLIAINDEKQRDVRRKAIDFLRQYNRKLEKLFFSELVDRLPSAYQILRNAYILAPVALMDLFNALIDSGYPPASERWLNRQLDDLLRKKMVAWEKNLYTVTGLGIGMLPAGRGKSSADVQRALALGKRKWY